MFIKRHKPKRKLIKKLMNSAELNFVVLKIFFTLCWYAFVLISVNDNNTDKQHIFSDQGSSISQHVVNVGWLSRKQLFGGYVLQEKIDDNYISNLQVS